MPGDLDGDGFGDIAEAAWFRVPGGWCSSATVCTERDLTTAFALAGRELRGDGWTIGGVARVVPPGSWASTPSPWTAFATPSPPAASRMWATGPPDPVALTDRW